MQTELTWADIQKKMLYLTSVMKLSDDDAFVFSNLCDLSRRVGEKEGRERAINDVSSVMSEQLARLLEERR